MLLPNAAYADITVIPIVDAVDAVDVVYGGSTPVTTGTVDQAFSADIEITLDIGLLAVDAGTTLRADWAHEFEDDAEIIEVGFANDPLRNDPTNPTQPILVSTDERDSDYFVYSAGLSLRMIRGVAGFLNYRTTQDLEDQSLTDITWGLRFEREW